MPYFPPCKNRLTVPISGRLVMFECEYDKGHFGVHVSKGEVVDDNDGRKIWYSITWRGDPDPEYEKKNG